MRERPHILTAPMVRAALAGHKTQLRAPVAPVGKDAAVMLHHEVDKGWWAYRTADGAVRGAPQACPFGMPGDRLWVREAFIKVFSQSKRWIETDHQATYKHGDRLGDHIGMVKRWSRARDMPREAARLLLDITHVRVEPLRAISEEEALAEGAPRDMVPGAALGWFRAGWERDHGDGAWTANPWVWVLTVKRSGH